MNTNLRRLLPLVLLLALVLTGRSTTGFDESLEFVSPPTGKKFIRWHGVPGWTYFVQVSDPADHLKTWTFAPIIEGGNNVPISYEIDEPTEGLPEKGFFRLKYTDQVPGPNEDLDTADFDGDGLSNLDEITIYHTDPLNPDTDGDGLPDGWEVAHNLNPNDGSDAANLFPGSNVSNLQAFNAGVQVNPNATMDNFDGDDLANDNDADPNDGTIDWKRTADPTFAVIELSVPDPDSLRLDDLSEKGTVLFTRCSESQPIERVVVDRICGVHSFPIIPQGLGDFGSYGPTLINDRVIGEMIVQSEEWPPTELIEYGTWDPVDNSYLADAWPAYFDDIRDVRNCFRVDTNYNTLTQTMGDGLFTPQGTLDDSTHGNARIEENGNIVSESSYWRYDPDTSSYGSRNSLSESNFGSSATLIQIESAPPGGAELRRTWNLVPSSTGLYVSADNATFVKSQLVLGSSRIPLGVTNQGWVATASEIWSNGTWHSLRDLVSGTKPQQVSLLGILDTGLGVARIQYESGPPRIALLIPVELISDLNNDGQITLVDNELRIAALKSDATTLEKRNGTEYMFVNDKMSNGAWDVEDDGLLSFSYSPIGDGYGTLPKPPTSHKDDDDAEPLRVRIGINTGVVWFAHLAISEMEFFKTKECKPNEKILIDYLHPLDLSNNKLPEIIYVRVNPGLNILEWGGRLQMHWGMTVDDPKVTLELPLTIVQRFGAAHYFYAARDYIEENNRRLFIRDEGYPILSTSPDIVFRICVMLEEATSVRAFDATTDNCQGIEGCAFGLGAYPAAVIINGNQCFWNAGWSETNILDLPNMIGNIVDKCHGRVIGATTIAGISSDNYDPTTKPAGGSVLAGPDPIPAGMIAGPDGLVRTADDIPNPDAGTAGGKFIGHTSGPGWEFAAGQASGTDALGGLSTNYGSTERQDKPHQMIGHAIGSEDGKGCIFTATQMKGVGYAPTFMADASASGVPPLTPSTDSSAIQLFILDSGAGSLGLMHIDPSGVIRGAYIGRKSKYGFPYYVNNYLALCPSKPRP